MKTFENTPPALNDSGHPLYNLVNAGIVKTAGFPCLFRENRPHISQGHSVRRENQIRMKKAPPGRQSGRGHHQADGGLNG